MSDKLTSRPAPLPVSVCDSTALSVCASSIAVAFLAVAAFAAPSWAQTPAQAPASGPVAPVASNAGAQPAAGQPVDRLAYHLGPDDQVVLQVPNAPELNGKSLRIDPSGDLRLPMVGRISAGGMTVEQLEVEVRTRLKQFLQEPDVSISVTEFKSQPVSVIGAVGTSGVRQLEGRKTLIELLSLAGGVTADAGPVVRIARRIDQGPVPLPGAAPDSTGEFSIADIDLRALLESRNPEMNIVIRPHDVVSIPRAEMVFIVGEVGKPGPVPLSVGSSVSVLEAVSSAGGVLRTASTSNVRILRQRVGDQTRTELNLDLKKVMQGKAEDVPMMAGDILVIPDSKGKRAGARALEAAIQAGVIIGTYGLVR